MKARGGDACMRDRLARTLANIFVFGDAIDSPRPAGWPPGEWRKRPASVKQQWYDLADKVIAMVKEEAS